MKPVVCMACIKKRLHTKAEYKRHHPLGGHGYTREWGPTHPDIPDYRNAKTSK